MNKSGLKLIRLCHFSAKTFLVCGLEADEADYCSQVIWVILCYEKEPLIPRVSQSTLLIVNTMYLLNPSWLTNENLIQITCCFLIAYL